MGFNKRQLKEKIVSYLISQGYNIKKNMIVFPPAKNKESVRRFHEDKRHEKLKASIEFLNRKSEKLLNYFANGKEISPKNIRPRLEVVQSESLGSELFRMATLLWSVPVSSGFGRRIRFIVWDEYNEKLIGLIGLADPVFNLKVRDDWIGWNANDRRERLYHVMDIHVLGAVPPYSYLIGGKLVAALATTDEVRRVFQNKYKNKYSIISKKNKPAQLVLLTTISALGKSSIYNRLKVNGTSLYESIGFTNGWGHFHVSSQLFEEMRTFLESIKHPYAKENRFGDGPNWKMRLIRKAFMEIGLSPDLLMHGIRREVFIIPLAYNYKEFLKGKHKKPRYIHRSVQEVAEFCKERWIIPRAKRDDRYLEFKREDIINQLLKGVRL